MAAAPPSPEPSPLVPHFLPPPYRATPFGGGTGVLPGPGPTFPATSVPLSLAVASGGPRSANGSRPDLVALMDTRGCEGTTVRYDVRGMGTFRERTGNVTGGPSVDSCHWLWTVVGSATSDKVGIPKKL